MNRTLKVAVLFGGRSGEHDVSLVSARAIITELEKNPRFEVLPVGITRAGRWIMHPGALAALTRESRLAMKGTAAAVEDRVEAPVGDERTALVPGDGTSPLVNLGDGEAATKVDVVFPVLHGPMGEDGTVQGFFELAGLPYVGAGVASSAACMDKDLSKRILRDAGLTVADSVTIRRSAWREDREGMLDLAMKAIGFPSFVKPANMGSSVGITRVSDMDHLAAGLDEAARYDIKMIVEKAIDAREIECAVLGNDRPDASVPGEIVPSGEFYDYTSKYVDGTSEIHIPADLPRRKSDEIRARALDAFRALDCAGMARVDFLLERKSDTLFVNELNTIPGFTPISMYAKLWEASGVPYGALLERLIDLALERREDRFDVESEFQVPRGGE